MLAEQRENQQSTVGHDYGNSQFKLVGIHILEMYNPLKKFLTQQGGKGTDKEGTAKKDKKQTGDLVSQISQQMKEIKAAQPQPEAEVKSKITQVANQTGTDLGATQTSQKTGTRGKQTMRYRQPKLVANLYYTKY